MHEPSSTHEPHSITPFWIRMLAVPAAFATACLVAPLPTMALPSLEPNVFSDGGPGVLLALPLFALFTGIFAGPFALPIILVLAARNVRSVGAHVGLGALASVPAMFLFSALMEGLSAPIAGAIVGGGALGGLTVSAVRENVERWLSSLARPRETHAAMRLPSRGATH